MSVRVKLQIEALLQSIGEATFVRKLRNVFESVDIDPELLIDCILPSIRLGELGAVKVIGPVMGYSAVNVFTSAFPPG